MGRFSVGGHRLGIIRAGHSAAIRKRGYRKDWQGA